jgi:putative FmdB family regulatory protein
MPIFDYKCRHCGATREVLITAKVRSGTLLPCLKCDRPNCMEKQMGAANIVNRSNLRIPASKQRKRIL